MQDVTPLQRLVNSQVSIFSKLVARRADLARYRFVMEELSSGDVRVNATYQRTFNGLYMVRRGTHWRGAFYDLLETNKHRHGLEFQYVLEELHKATGRIEASFASKLMATINPGLPVYDSWVRHNLSLPTRVGSAQPRIEHLCADYTTIQELYEAMIASPSFGDLRLGFDEALPEFSDITDVKKLDFMFWQAR